MAQYFLSYTGLTTGTSPPTNHTERWSASGGYGTGTDCVEYDPPFSNNFDFLSWDVPGDVSGDQEILVKLRTTSATGNQCGVVLAGSTSATSGYYVSLITSGTEIGIIRLDTGTEATPTTASFTWAADTDYWIRAGISGTTVRARVWADGGGEPGTWTVSVTDSTYSTGRLGMFVRNGFNGTKRWAQIGVGTGGDSAPSSSVGSNNVLAWIRA